MIGEASRLAFDNKVTALKEQYKSFTAEQIQMVNATNNQIASTFARAGTAVFKRWVSLEDSRVRDSHAEAHGQFQVLESPFLVGGEKGYYPGDNGFSARERINCRCIVVFEDADGRDLLSYRTQRAGKKRIDQVLAQF